MFRAVNTVRGAVLQRGLTEDLSDEPICEQRPVCPEKISPGYHLRAGAPHVGPPPRPSLLLFLWA